MTFITICNLAENKEALWTSLLESFTTLRHKSEKKNTMMRVFIGSAKDVEEAIALLHEKSSELTESSVRYYVTDLESADIVHHYMSRGNRVARSNVFFEMENRIVENTKKSLASKGITNTVACPSSCTLCTPKGVSIELTLEVESGNDAMQRLSAPSRTSRTKS